MQASMEEAKAAAVALGQHIAGARAALDTLQDSLLCTSEAEPPHHVDELRDFVHQTHRALSAAQTSLALRIVLNHERQRTTRSDYLLTLHDRIGPAPNRSWEMEWDAMTRDQYESAAPAAVATTKRRHNSLLRHVLASEKTGDDLALPPSGLGGGGSWSSCMYLARDPSRGMQLLGTSDDATAASAPAAGAMPSCTRSSSEYAIGSDAATSKAILSARASSSRGSSRMRASSQGDLTACLTANSLEVWAANPDIRREISKRVVEGWDTQDARAFELICTRRKTLAQALRAEQSTYAASTYAVCEALAKAAVRQAASKTPLAPQLYRHLYGVQGLVEDDPAWHNILKADLCVLAPALAALPSPCMPPRALSRARNITPPCPERTMPATAFVGLVPRAQMGSEV